MALALIDSLGSGSYAFEQAYSFYRLHRETDAREALDAIKEKQSAEDRGILHLEAQLVCASDACDVVTNAYSSIEVP